MSETNEDPDYDRSEPEVILLEPIGEEDHISDSHDPEARLSAGDDERDDKKSDSEGRLSEPEWVDDIDDPEVRLLESEEGTICFEIYTCV